MDPIRPEYYTKKKPEPIAVIESWHLPFHLGTVLKYIARYQEKGGITDLKKARWFLDRYIKLLEKSNANTKM